MIYKWQFGDFYVLTARRDVDQAIRAFKDQYGLDVQASQLTCTPCIY